MALLAQQEMELYPDDYQWQAAKRFGVHNRPYIMLCSVTFWGKL